MQRLCKDLCRLQKKSLWIQPKCDMHQKIQQRCCSLLHLFEWNKICVSSSMVMAIIKLVPLHGICQVLHPQLMNYLQSAAQGALRQLDQGFLLFTSCWNVLGKDATRLPSGVVKMLGSFFCLAMCRDPIGHIN